MTLKDIREKMKKAEIATLFNRGGHKETMYPSDKAKILDSMPDEEALHAFNSLGEEQIAIFPHLDIDLQKKIIDQLPRERVSHILNGLSSDDRMSLFATLEDLDLPEYLDYLNQINKDTTHDLLEYPEHSVAVLVNTSFTTIRADMTVEQAIQHLRTNLKDTETADVIFVVDAEGQLMDDMPLRRLLVSDPNSTVRDIMDGVFVSLDINDTKEDAIARFKEYDRVVLPVLNKYHKILGVVTIDDVLDVAEEKDTREMQQFGGMESLDLPYVETPFITLIRKRAVWLIILFLSEMMTTSAMGYFSKELEKAIVLTIFIPLIISSGGNSGSQAATLIIRAMALKEISPRQWWYVMRREILSGLTLGIILGTVGFLRITAWQEFHIFNYGPHWFMLGITIFFTLIGIVLWGTLAGSMIPIILKKFKIDPATSSAPFVATLVDVTGLVIYFSIAAILLKGTLL